MEKRMALLLFGMLFLTSGGCVSYEFQSVRTGVHAYESGSLQQFEIVSQTICYPIPAPCGWSWVLVEPGTPHSRRGKLIDISESPPYRQLVHTPVRGVPDLLNAAEGIAKSEPHEYIRWVLGTNPLIVGIGTTALKPREEGVPYWIDPVSGVPMLPGVGTTKLITTEDLNEELSMLLVCDRWGPDMLSGPARRIVLKPHASIAEVFKQKPWAINSQPSE